MSKKDKPNKEKTQGIGKERFASLMKNLEQNKPPPLKSPSKKEVSAFTRGKMSTVRSIQSSASVGDVIEILREKYIEKYPVGKKLGQNRKRVQQYSFFNNILSELAKQCKNNPMAYQKPVIASIVLGAADHIVPKIKRSTGLTGRSKLSDAIKGVSITALPLLKGTTYDDFNIEWDRVKKGNARNEWKNAVSKFVHDTPELKNKFSDVKPPVPPRTSSKPRSK